MSYLRSIHLQKDKSVFKLDELPIERFAESLGLPGAPKVKFLKKQSGHGKQKLPPQRVARKTEEQAESMGEEDDQSSDGSEESEEEVDRYHSSSGDERKNSTDTSIKPSKVITSTKISISSAQLKFYSLLGYAQNTIGCSSAKTRTYFRNTTPN